MELRSGTVLNFQIPESMIQNTTRKDSVMIQELKTLFRILFYHMCAGLGFLELLKEFRASREGKPLDMMEFSTLRVDNEAWYLLYHKVWDRMQLEFPLKKVLQLIPYILCQEYEVKPENPAYSESNGMLEKYIQGLYENNTCERMIEFMDEERRINELASVVRNRNLYLNQIATRLSCQVFALPDRIRTTSIPWETITKSVRNECCFIAEGNSGCTVVKLPYVYFTMIPTHEFKILETGEKFTSYETNARKALLLHKRCTKK